MLGALRGFLDAYVTAETRLHPHYGNPLTANPCPKVDYRCMPDEEPTVRTRDWVRLAAWLLPVVGFVAFEVWWRALSSCADNPWWPLLVFQGSPLLLTVALGMKSRQTARQLGGHLAIAVTMTALLGVVSFADAFQIDGCSGT